MQSGFTHVQLMKFYNVNTVDELIQAMEEHIVRLQEKVKMYEKPISFFPIPSRIG